MAYFRSLYNRLSKVSEIIITIYRSIQFVWFSSPRWTIINALLVIAQSLIPLIALYGMKLVIDAVSSSLSSSDPASEIGAILLLIAFVGGISLVGVACRTLSNLAHNVQTEMVTDHMYDILHAKSLEVDLAYYENPKYYDTLHRAQEEAPYRPQAIVQGLLQLGQHSLSLVTMIGLLIVCHWSVVAILFASAIPIMLIRLRSANKFYEWECERTPQERQAFFLNWMLTGDIYAKEIRLFNLGDYFAQQFHRIRSKLREERFHLTRKYTLAELGAELCTSVAVICTLAFITYRALHGLMTLGDLVMYYQAVQRAQNLTVQVLKSFGRLYQDNLFLAHLYAFLNLKPTIDEPRVPKSVPRSVKTGLVLDRVSFQYPNDTRKVLEDISLSSGY